MNLAPRQFMVWVSPVFLTRADLTRNPAAAAKSRKRVLKQLMNLAPRQFTVWVSPVFLSVARIATRPGRPLPGTCTCWNNGPLHGTPGPIQVNMALSEREMHHNAHKKKPVSASFLLRDIHYWLPKHVALISALRQRYLPMHDAQANPDSCKTTHLPRSVHIHR
jgi:hypothetical protein